MSGVTHAWFEAQWFTCEKSEICRGWTCKIHVCRGRNFVARAHAAENWSHGATTVVAPCDQFSYHCHLRFSGSVPGESARVIRFPVGFLPPLTPEENLWRWVVEVFTGWNACCSCYANNSVKVLKETERADSTYWPGLASSFLHSRRSAEERGTASFMLAFWHCYAVPDLLYSLFTVSQKRPTSDLL